MLSPFAHHVAYCCMLLRVIASCCAKFETGQTFVGPTMLEVVASLCTKLYVWKGQALFFFSVYVFFMIGFWALKRETWPRPLTFLWPVNTTGSSPRFILSPAFTTREERLIVGRLGSWMCCLCFISANGWTFSDKDENRLTVFLLLFDLCRT